MKEKQKSLKQEESFPAGWLEEKNNVPLLHCRL
jgi:hypothetical protein